jgi:hypothetical protein
MQWDQPLAWGVSQPLDQDTWYKNRLRVEITAPTQNHAQVWLTDEAGQVLSQSESIANLAILHSEPPNTVLAQVVGTPGTPLDLTTYWPDRVNETVTVMQFSGIELSFSAMPCLIYLVTVIKSRQADFANAFISETYTPFGMHPTGDWWG